MPTTDNAVLNRSDTLLGVCQAIGQDFGVKPLWLRLGFAGLLFWNLAAAIGIYLALGVAVLASRMLFPSHRAQDIVPVGSAAPIGDNDDAGRELARAA